MVTHQKSDVLTSSREIGRASCRERAQISEVAAWSELSFGSGSSHRDGAEKLLLIRYAPNPAARATSTKYVPGERSGRNTVCSPSREWSAARSRPAAS